MIFYNVILQLSCNVGQKFEQIRFSIAILGPLIQGLSVLSKDDYHVGNQRYTISVVSFALLTAPYVPSVPTTSSLKHEVEESGFTFAIHGWARVHTYTYVVMWLSLGTNERHCPQPGPELEAKTYYSVF